MFDISWTEFLLIGVVALVVIGPKELPGVMRTLGQWTRKVRSMASEFQGQFHEAMREAEMSDLKKTVDDMARDVTDIDPLKSVREDVESVGKDLHTSLNAAASADPSVPVPEAAEPALIESSLPSPAAADATDTLAPAPPEVAVPMPAEQSHDAAAIEMEPAGLQAVPAPEHPAENTAQDGPGRVE